MTNKLLNKMMESLRDKITQSVEAKGTILSQQADTWIKRGEEFFDNKLQERVQAEGKAGDAITAIKYTVAAVTTKVIYELLKSGKAEK